MILPASAWWSGRKHARNISTFLIKARRCRRALTIFPETDVGGLSGAGTYKLLLLFHELQRAKAFRNMETVAHRGSPGNIVPTRGRSLTTKEIDSESIAGRCR